MLRQVAHEIAPDPSSPVTGDEGHDRLLALVEGFRSNAPRKGLGAVIGRFADHLAGVAKRYGRSLFHCFDDSRIPSTSNALEGFFGISKAQLRHALGTSSTTNGVAQNLGADYLLALAHTRSTSSEDLLELTRALSLDDYVEALQALKEAERPATLRRSRKRFPAQHLSDLLARWAQTCRAEASA